MPVHDLQVAILMDDVQAICRAPGVGKKTAQRITLELRDKVSQTEVSSLAPSGGTATVVPSDSLTEAMEALMALGYSSAEARSALSQVRDKTDRTDELITLALRAMASM